MIPVQPQPEPAHFEAQVRQKGEAFLKQQGLSLDQPVPIGTELMPYWRTCLPALHQAYGGVCAYLAIYFERITGGGSVDHFVAKSKMAGLAYEWDNYRLACSTMNSRKGVFDDVLDPFLVGDGWFRLELVFGSISPNPALAESVRGAVQGTINRLGLDDEVCKEMRSRHYSDYLKGAITADYLKRISPFVWSEALRQGLL